jgi:hypothetical protein
MKCKICNNIDDSLHILITTYINSPRNMEVFLAWYDMWQQPDLDLNKIMLQILKCHSPSIYDQLVKLIVLS